MPDHPVSLHPSPPFDHDYYDHPRSRAAAEEAKAGVRGHCQECGEKRPLEAHHYAKGPYPPAHLTTADDLTALCRDCHAKAHLGRFLHDVGGVSEEDYLAAHSELVAQLVRPVDDGLQVGWVVSFEGEWGAIVTGRAIPRVGEHFWLFLRSSRTWENVVVTEVVDGRPGHWRVRKRWTLDAGDDTLRQAAA